MQYPMIRLEGTFKKMTQSARGFFKLSFLLHCFHFYNNATQHLKLEISFEIYLNG